MYKNKFNKQLTKKFIPINYDIFLIYILNV